MSSSLHIDKRKNILILGEGPTSKAKYYINFTQSGKGFVLSLHYNGRNSFLLVNDRKIYQFKAKDSEIKKYPFCLGNISGDFSASNMKKERIK